MYALVLVLVLVPIRSRPRMNVIINPICCYILFIYGWMGYNLGLNGKTAKMLNLIMKIIFKMS